MLDKLLLELQPVILILAGNGMGYLMKWATDKIPNKVIPVALLFAIPILDSAQAWITGIEAVGPLRACGLAIASVGLQSALKHAKALRPGSSG